MGLPFDVGNTEGMSTVITDAETGCGMDVWNFG